MFHVRGSVLAQVRRCIPSRVLLRPSSTTSWNTGLLSVPIVGRPNVGKSTLFNRFARAAVGRRGGGGSGGVGFGGRRPASKAIVSPVAGTTRDRREGPAAIAGAQFIAVDTGGLESLDGSGGGSAYGDLRSEIAKQVAAAVARARVALFMVDAREGVTPLDKHFALWARKQPDPPEGPRKWIIVVNKAEELIARGEEVHFDYDSSGKSDRDYRENQALLSLHQMASGSGDDGDFDSSNGGYCGRASRRGASTLAMLTSDVQRLGLGGDVVLLSAQNGEGFGALADALLPFIEPESFADRSYHEGEEGDEEEGFLEESATHGSNTAIDGHQSNEMSEADFDIAEADALAHRDGDDSAHNGLDRNEVNEREGEAKSNSNSSSGWRAPPQVDSTIELAIVGRPNVGKSSLVNALVNEARVVVGPMPGVTRDSIPVHWTLVDPSKRRPDRRLKLVDTAGIRKFTMERNPRGGGVQTLWAASAGQSGSSSMLHQSSGSSGRGGSTATASSVAAAHRHAIGGGAGAALELQLEQEAVNASLKALGMASVVVLVLDGSALNMRRLELALAGRILEEGRALVIAANKADLLEGTSIHKFQSGVQEQASLLLPQHGHLPVVALSALTGKGVDKVLPAVVSAHDRWAARVPTGLLNRWLRALERHHPPPRQSPKGGSKPGAQTSGGAVKLKYMTQLKGRPPTFAIWANRAEALRPDYLAFLRNNLRDEFGFQGIPMRLLLRSTNVALRDRLDIKAAAAKTSAAKARKKKKQVAAHDSDVDADDAVAPATPAKAADVTVKITPARAPAPKIPKHKQPHTVRLGHKRRHQSSKGRPPGTKAQRGR